MSQFLRLVLLLCVLSFVLREVGMSASKKAPPPPRESSVKRLVAKVCGELNKHLPRTLNPQLRLDQVSPGPGRTIEFRYTFLNLVRSKNADPTAFTNTIRPLMVEHYRNEPGVESVRKAGIIVNHRFFDKNGIYLADIDVGPDDLK